MRTPSEIAKHVAESLVTIRQRGDWIGLAINGETVATMTGRLVATEIRRQVALAVEQAIETALRQCPVPAGLSDAHLDNIIKLWNSTLAITRVAEINQRLIMLGAYLPDLLAHIEHLHRILHSPESEAIVAAYEQGKREGERKLLYELLTKQLEVRKGDSTGIGSWFDVTLCGKPVRTYLREDHANQWVRDIITIAEEDDAQRHSTPGVTSGNATG